MPWNPTGPCPARIMIVSEFPSEDDLRRGEPLTGYAGDEFGRMLQEARIFRNQCFLTCALRDTPPDKDVTYYLPQKKKDITAHHIYVGDKPALPIVADWAAQLAREIEMVRPNLIIALGDAALWMLTGEWSVFKWRGSMLNCNITALDYQPKVIPTYAPGKVLANWSWRPIAVQDLRRAERESHSREYQIPEWRFLTAPTFVQAIAVLDQLLSALAAGPVKLALDIETRCGHISDFGIAWSKLDAICIPLMTTVNPAGYWSADEELEIIWRLYQICRHPNLTAVGQNFLYDAQYIDRWWMFPIDRPFDTMIAQHSCFSNMQKSLDFLASMYCTYYRYWKDEGRDWDTSMPELQHWEYNCKDTVNTFEISDVLPAVASSMGLQKVGDFQQSLFRPVLRTMLHGVRINKQLRADYALYLHDEIAKRQQWLNDVIGGELNIRSSDQMKEFFYGMLRQKPIFNRKTKAVSCDDEALRTIWLREPMLKPVVKKIAEMRSLGVFLSTFVNAPLDVDGRMRCSFNIAGTETYRFSSSKNAFGSGMNMQNIPKGGESDELDLELPNVRELFIPDPGKTFFDIDLDSADLRIVCWEADIPEMKAMVRSGAKVYVEVMKEYYKDPTMTKNSSKYGTFKSLCHGTHYLGTAKGLAERLGLGVHEVDVIQKWYFGKFPELQKWHDKIKDQVTRRRYVENIFGYRNYFFDRIEGTIFNQAVAWIPQSSVACLINRAYVAIDEQLPEVEILLQVHDSLAGQFPTAGGQKHLDDILRLAHIELPYDDPLIIPVGVKTSTRSWGDCD